MITPPCWRGTKISVEGQFEEAIPSGLKPIPFKLTHYQNFRKLR